MVKRTVQKGDPSVQADLDVLIEFSMCTKDDVQYALQRAPVLVLKRQHKGCGIEQLQR